MENAHLLAEQAGPPVELYVEPGVDHTAAYAADPAGYARRVADFFDHALGAQ